MTQHMTSVTQAKTGFASTFSEDCEFSYLGCHLETTDRNRFSMGIAANDTSSRKASQMFLGPLISRSSTQISTVSVSLTFTMSWKISSASSSILRCSRILFSASMFFS